MLISITGFIFSIKYLRPKESGQLGLTLNKQVATVVKLNNEVQRQLENQLSWHAIETSEMLLKGDKIKTNKTSSVVIKFAKNNTILNIEPSSIAVIDQNDEQIGIKLIVGNVFVKQSSKNEKIQISTGENGKNKLELNHAEAAVSVSEQGKPLVEIIKGAITSNGHDIKQNLNFFGELRPNYGETIYINTGKANSINLSWSPPEIRNYKIIFEFGKTRDDLVELQPQNLIIDKGNASFNNIVGTKYWRMKAILNNKEGTYVTPVMKFTVENVHDPVLIAPIDNDNIRVIEADNNMIDFKWNLPTPLHNIKIQVSKTSSFSHVLHEDIVSKQTYYETNKIIDEAKYFWRVQGSILGSEERITSNVHSFSLKKGKAVMPPSIIAPNNNHIEYAEKSNNKEVSILLNWNPEINAHAYILNLKCDGQKKEIIVAQTSYVLNGLSGQHYTWSVRSIDEYQKKSVPSELRSFKLAALETVDFEVVPVREIQFIKALPLLNFKWKDFGNAVSYIMYASTSSNFLDKIKFNLKKNSFQMNGLSQGENFFYVEVLDRNLQIIAKSKIVSTILKIKDLPSPPRFSNVTGKTINASLDGSVEIIFDLLKTKEQLMIELKNSQDVIVEKSTITSNKVVFSNLRPGNFKVQAKLIDEDERVSDYSEIKNIFVQGRNSLKIPKIKNIKIK